MNYIRILAFLILPEMVWAQATVSGYVSGTNGVKPVPIAGVNVYWMGTQIGTSTDSIGFFSLPLQGEVSKLIVSFIGYKSDTLTVTKASTLNIVLDESVTLQEAQVEAREDAIKLDLKSAQNVQTIGQKELLKAPCCNLSESFETNPSIDASFTDAATGSRQIQMLGLSGIYSQQMQENMPGLRGSLQVQGLAFVPGPWVQSIQVSKGAGSVMNGFESMTGQINYELRKPTDENRLFINAYGNQSSRSEFNLVYNQDVGQYASTGVFAHASGRFTKNDNNNDDFLDMPLGHQIRFLNRWKFQWDNGWESVLLLSAMDEDKFSGQLNYDPERSMFTNLTHGHYGIRLRHQGYRVWPN